MPTHARSAFVSLGEVDILRELSEPALQYVAHTRATISVRKGMLVFKPGDAPALYVVLDGRIISLVRHRDGSEIELFARHRGDVFGEVSLLLDEQVNAARAVEDSLVERLDAKAVGNALRQSQPATQALSVVVAKRMTAVEERLGEIAQHRVKDRLHSILWHLASEERIADSRGYLIRDPYTHAELARMVGARRVAVTRALGELERGGELLLSRHRIVVCRQP